MTIELYINKIYLIKPHSVPSGYSISYHYAKWVSPRPTDLRIDKYIDIPYENITFIAAYAIGDITNGERHIEIGVAGFPSMIRVPFGALSPNEFRFPSKNVDENIKHVCLEIVKNSRLIAISEDVFKFLWDKQIPCFDNFSLLQVYINSYYSLINGKVPFKCKTCKKFLWLDIEKMPASPTKAKCPSCGEYFKLATPEGFDTNLERFVPSDNETTNDNLLLSITGEFQPPPTSGETTKKLDVDINEILGLQTPQAEGSELKLDDNFFDNILPEEKTEGTQQKEAGERIPAEQFSPSADLVGEIEKNRMNQGFEGRICPVCGTEVGSEKICPNCFSEILPDDIDIEEELSGEDEKTEIRLKELPEENIEKQEQSEFQVEHMTEYLPTEQEAIPSEPLSEQTSVNIPFWEEKIWSIKTEEDVYENLDMQTIEQWILECRLTGKDLVKKDESKKWSELKNVPYFREAFKRVKDTVQIGTSDATASFFPAPMVNRVIAFLVDSVICYGLYYIGAIIWLFSLIARKHFDTFDYISLFIGPHFLFPFLYLSVSNGVFSRTIGKAIVKIAVIGKNGKPLGLIKGLLRTLIWIFTFGWGFSFALFNKEKQALHDKAIESFVISVE